MRAIGEAVTAPDGTQSRILIRDTWNTDIVPELAPEAGNVVLYKNRFSGFYETNLDQILKTRSIKTLIFTGCTTSVCVESTSRDAMFRDYVCLLLADCTAEPIGDGLPRSNHDAENGSAPSWAFTSAASPSIPLRKSTGLVAIRTFSPLETAIMP